MAQEYTIHKTLGTKSHPFHAALVIPSLRIGGAERSTLRIARGLVERGHRVDVVLLGSTNALWHDVPSGAHTIGLPPSNSNESIPLRDYLAIQAQVGFPLSPLVKRDYVRNAISLGAYIDDQRPDIVLPTLPGAKIATFLTARRTVFKPRIVPIFRNHLLRRSWKERLLISRLIHRVDHSIAVSDGVADSIRGNFSVAGERVTRIYNPVLVPELHHLADAKPEHPWFADPNIPIVLAAGRLDRVKDFPTLIRAFWLTRRKRIVRLILLGDGGWRSRLERQVRKLGLADSVSMPGWVANPYSYMRRASAFLLSSRFEGLGNVLVEALACGCPCASTDCPAGPSEILANGRVGPLVPVGDPGALSTALEKLLDNPPDPTTLQEGIERFSYESAIARYEHLIHQVLRKPISEESATTAVGHLYTSPVHLD